MEETRKSAGVERGSGMARWRPDGPDQEFTPKSLTIKHKMLRQPIIEALGPILGFKTVSKRKTCTTLQPKLSLEAKIGNKTAL